MSLHHHRVIWLAKKGTNLARAGVIGQCGAMALLLWSLLLGNTLRQLVRQSQHGQVRVRIGDQVARVHQPTSDSRVSPMDSLNSDRGAARKGLFSLSISYISNGEEHADKLVSIYCSTLCNHKLLTASLTVPLSPNGDSMSTHQPLSVCHSRSNSSRYNCITNELWLIAS